MTLPGGHEATTDNVSGSAYALATTVHDPDGHLLDGIGRIGPDLADVFDPVVVSATSSTDPEVLRALERSTGARVVTHPPGGSIVGRARRDAVRLCLESRPERVCHGDLDHLLRWIDDAPEEVAAVLGAGGSEDLVVVGRSEAALARSPRRLRETEHLVNHVYELATGRSWDLMFAIRLLSSAGARCVVDGGVVDTMANDVEWIFLVERAGLSVGYIAADHLEFRTTSEFDRPDADLDGDPFGWIDRVDVAHGHLAVLRRFLTTTGG